MLTTPARAPPTWLQLKPGIPEGRYRVPYATSSRDLALTETHTHTHTEVLLLWLASANRAGTDSQREMAERVSAPVPGESRPPKWAGRGQGEQLVSCSVGLEEWEKCAQWGIITPCATRSLTMLVCLRSGRYPNGGCLTVCHAVLLPQPDPQSGQPCVSDPSHDRN